MLRFFIFSLSTPVPEADIVSHLDWPGKQAARWPLGAPVMDRPEGSSPAFSWEAPCPHDGASPLREM